MTDTNTSSPSVATDAQMPFFDSEELVKQARRYLSALKPSLTLPEGADLAGTTSSAISSLHTTQTGMVNRGLTDGNISATRAHVHPLADICATPLQIWEGRILSVDRARHSMAVLLSAKMGKVADHAGEIDLEWVAEQDADLVSPGAVFYLTLYKRLKRGTVENAQELRFRRLPNWSKQQLRQVREDTALVLSKISVAKT